MSKEITFSRGELWFWLWIAFLVGSLIVSTAYAIWIPTSKDGYKRGQIDALTGKINYHLVTNSDSTKTWELIQNQPK